MIIAVLCAAAILFVAQALHVLMTFGLDKSLALFYDVQLFSLGWQAMFDEKRISRDRRGSGEDTREAGEIVERRQRRRRQMSIREISFTEWARYFALYKRRK